MNENIICPICKRNVPQCYTEKHHLVPKSKKGKEGVLMCVNCGDIIHKLFTNKELEKEYNTVEKLNSNEKIQKWANWVGKKNDFSVCMKHKKRS